MSSSPHTDRLKALAAKRRAAAQDPGAEGAATPPPDDTPARETARPARGSSRKAVQQNWKNIAMTAIAVALAILTMSLVLFVGYFLPKMRSAEAEVAQADQEKRRKEEQLAAEKAEREKVEQNLREAQTRRGTLVVETVPPGAIATLGSEPPQATPARFERVKAGDYPLRLDLKGHSVVEFPVTIVHNKTTNLPVVALERSKGTLVIDSDPPQARYSLMLSNVVVQEGVAPVQFKEVPTDIYTVKLVMGDAVIEDDVEVTDGQTVRFAPRFAFGTVTLESNPPGATIMRRDKVVGTTPARLVQQVAGTQTYQLRLRRYFSTNLTMNVVADQDTRVNVALQANPGPRPGAGFVASSGLEMVWLSTGWWVSRHEVTQKVFETVTQSNPSIARGANRPVENISWRDAMSFCRALTSYEDARDTLPRGYTYTLPTSQQWSTFSAGMPALRPTGGSAMVATNPVGRGSANRLGLYDIRGNVWEWCLDSAGGDKRVVRGGGYTAIYQGTQAAYDVAAWGENRAAGNIGFRVILVP